MNSAPQEHAANYEKHLAELRQRFFYQHPETLPQAIAKHYTAHAIIALQLLELIDLKENQKFAEPSAMAENLDDAIDHCVQQIRTNHLLDFGTPLQNFVKQ